MQLNQILEKYKKGKNKSLSELEEVFDTIKISDLSDLLKDLDCVTDVKN